MNDSMGKDKIENELPCKREDGSHCSKLKVHLLRRNISFEENINGNTTIIKIRKTPPYNRNVDE